MSSTDKPGASALLWTATLIATIGTWMDGLGAGWRMRTHLPSRSVFPLVQAAIAALPRERDGPTATHRHQRMDAPQPSIETQFLPSWAKHPEHQRRVTRHDAQLQAPVRALGKRISGPIVRHFIVPT